MSGISESSHPWMLQDRENYLGYFSGWVGGYRPDAQKMIVKILPKVPLSPVIHEILASAYQRILDNAPKEENERDKTAESMFLNIKQKVIEYVDKKRAQATSLEKFAETDTWAKEATKTQDEEKMKALLRASDHIEDTLFLAELASSCKLPASLSHLKLEIDGLVRNLSENYILLISLEEGSALREKLVAALQEVGQFYSKSEFEKALKKVKDISVLLH